jgi:hypothetical protein
MFMHFQSILKAGFVMALFLSVPCYAGQTGDQGYFENCKKISPKYKNGSYMDKCTDREPPDLDKIDLYSCDGNTCRFQLAPDYPGAPMPYVYAYKNMPYALCSEAFCDIITEDIDGIEKSYAQCTCPIYPKESQTNAPKGLEAPLASLGTQDRSNTLPIYDANKKMIYVTSTFSLANITAPTPLLMSDVNKRLDNRDAFVCRNNGQDLYYTDCFGVKCKVDPSDNTQAICNCPLKKGTEFVKPTDKGLCKPETKKVYCAVSPETFQYTTVDIFYDYFSKGD